jgi:hypothetical protein
MEKQILRSYFIKNLSTSYRSMFHAVLIVFIFICTTEYFEDTKGVIRIRISKERQHNDQKTNNNLKQKPHHRNLIIVINRLCRSVDDKCSANKQFYFSIKCQNVLVFICIVDCCLWLSWSVF